MPKFVKESNHMVRMGNTPLSVPNRTDEVETGSSHWYISFNSRDRSVYGAITTALVIGQGEVFLILNGDHRQQYYDIINGKIDGKIDGRSRLEKCIMYYQENKDKQNSMGFPL